MIHAIAAFCRFCIYSYYGRYLAYGINEILNFFKLKEYIKNEYIWISDFDHDLKLYLNPREHIGSRIYFEGYYETNEIWAVKRLLKKTGIAIDIGSNIGCWTLILSKLLNEGKVYSIEPSSTFNLLTNTMKANAALKNVLAYHIALGKDTESKYIVEAGMENRGLSHLVTSADSGLKVDQVRLTDFFHSENLNRIDFIKLDVEGMEWEVIQGGTDILNTYKPLLLIEFCESNLNTYNSSIAQVMNALQPLGYSYFYKAGRQGTLINIAINDYQKLNNNTVFCSNSPLK